VRDFIERESWARRADRALLADAPEARHAGLRHTVTIARAGAAPQTSRWISRRYIIQAMLDYLRHLTRLLVSLQSMTLLGIKRHHLPQKM